MRNKSFTSKIEKLSCVCVWTLTNWKAKYLAFSIPSAICREVPLLAHVPSFTKGLCLQSSSCLTSRALIWIYAQIVWSSGIKPRRVDFILALLLKGGWESRLPELIGLTCISSLLKPADSFKPSLNQTFVVKIYWELFTNEMQIWCSPRGRQILESGFLCIDRNVGLSGIYLCVHAAEPCSGDRHFQMALLRKEVS